MLERYEELNIGAAVLLVCCVRLRPVNSDLVAEECELMDTVFRMTVPTQPILRHGTRRRGRRTSSVAGRNLLLLFSKVKVC